MSILKSTNSGKYQPLTKAILIERGYTALTSTKGEQFIFVHSSNTKDRRLEFYDNSTFKTQKPEGFYTALFNDTFNIANLYELELLERFWNSLDLAEKNTIQKTLVAINSYNSRYSYLLSI